MPKNFDVASLCPDDRVDAWREFLAPIYSVYPKTDDRRSIFYSISHRKLATLDFNYIRGSANTAVRTGAMTRRDGLDQVRVRVQLSGASLFTCGDIQAETLPGSVLLQDCGHPFTTESDDFEAYSIYVPRAAIAYDAAGRHGLRALASHSASARLIRRSVLEIAGRAQGMSPEQAAETGERFCALIRGLLFFDMPDEAAASEIRMVLRQELRCHAATLTDWKALDPDAIAAQFSLTVQEVADEFRGDGGLAAFVRRNVVLRALAKLTKKPSTRETIREAAELSGFESTAAFVRMVKSEFGIDDVEVLIYPGNAAAQSGSHTAAADLPNFSEWLSCAVELLQPDLTYAVRSYIDRNLADTSLDAKKLCRIFNASRATIYRLFSSDGGVHRFITLRRLEAAHRELRLRQPRRGLVDEIARSFGFRDQAQFSRLFKAQFGQSPQNVLMSASD